MNFTFNNFEILWIIINSINYIFRTKINESFKRLFDKVSILLDLFNKFISSSKNSKQQVLISYFLLRIVKREFTIDINNL